MAKPREYFKFNFSKVVKFDCTCGRRYINTDKCLQETDSRMPQTRADVIRSMNDEELAKNRIDRIDMYTKSDFKEYIGDFNGIEFSEEESIKKELEWLQSEAE